MFFGVRKIYNKLKAVIIYEPLAFTITFCKSNRPKPLNQTLFNTSKHALFKSHVPTKNKI